MIGMSLISYSDALHIYSNPQIRQSESNTRLLDRISSNLANYNRLKTLESSIPKSWLGYSEGDEPQSEIIADSQEVGLEKRGSWERRESCHVVCSHCAEYASRRVAALCKSECKWQGDAYKVCLTLWTLIVQ